MRVLIQRISDDPTYAKALAWGKLITITGGAQVLIQALGFGSSLLIIKLLPVHEYALYTLANSMLGTMIVLADGGLSTGVLAQGGKVWQNPQKLGVILVTGLDLRFFFIVGSLAIAIPTLLYLLHNHGASWLIAFLIILAIGPAFISGLAATILQIPPRLKQDIVSLQINDIIANIGRLILVSLTIFIFPLSFLAIFVSGIPLIWSNTKLRKISARYADLTQKPDPAVRQEILAVVKRILPGSIYYCISGQITIWLVSIFGNTSAIAQLGALSRIAAIISIFSIMFTTLISPRFARIPNNEREFLLSKYLQLLLGLVILSAGIVGTAWLLSAKLVWALGKGYSGLEFEVLLSTISACLGLIAASCHSMCISRGWIVNPVISIPITLAAITIAVFIFRIDSLKGVLFLSIFTGSVEVLMYAIYTLFRIENSLR